jgi:hypothetical protein
MAPLHLHGYIDMTNPTLADWSGASLDEFGTDDEEEEEQDDE